MNRSSIFDTWNLVDDTWDGGRFGLMYVIILMEVVYITLCVMTSLGLSDEVWGTLILKRHGK